MTNTTEAQPARVVGQLLEAKGTDKAGGRIFGVRVIAYGDSANGRRYPRPVLEAAVGRYEGAKAFDHHRSEAEMRTGTVTGLVGSFRGVHATEDGLEGDLHLLPSAGHVAEVLDASLAAQEAGLPALAGISHDVYATWKQIVDGGQRLTEAVAITKVNSADVVADPAAGGQATRAVAGGTGDGTGSDGDGDQADLHDKSTRRAKAAVAAEVAASNLPAATVESVLGLLPDRFSEAQLGAAINTVQTVAAHAERNGLAPTTGEPADTTPTGRRFGEGVTGDPRDTKQKALDAMLASQPGGYRSLREAFLDISGAKVAFLGEDLNRRILRESFGAGYSSADRAVESLSAGSWALALGDSVTRAAVAEYAAGPWQTWKKIISSTTYGSDFRTQRRDRVGGYGVLPAVAEGGTYSPLTSPGNEEATYAITKRGGTEDLTLEMIANDDVNAVRRIPSELGKAAAQTLYRFVWDILTANAVTSYDGVALFAAGHSNTTAASPLSATNLSAARKRMRKQAAYGAATQLLSLTPRYVVVSSDNEELAFQLCTSPVAVPAGAPAGGASDVPNLHRGMEPIVVDYYSDVDDWYLVADPAMVPTIELGFYQRDDQPELFTQADPSVGSMFTADKLTFKLRHIYGGTVLDHRGFQRQVNP